MGLYLLAVWKALTLRDQTCHVSSQTGHSAHIKLPEVPFLVQTTATVDIVSFLSKAATTGYRMPVYCSFDSQETYMAVQVNEQTTENIQSL